MAADPEAEAGDKARARRLTACQTARSAAPGLVGRCSAQRDPERRVLTVTIRWAPAASESDRYVGRLKVEAALRYWVWEGWEVEVRDEDAR